MRILHTSDWHVGRAIRGRPRIEEFTAVLDEMIQIARDRCVDLVVIAGDLFDHRVPPADAEKLVYETLLRLRDTGAQVAAIAGNHESQPRLEAVSGLLSGLGVHLATRVRRPDEGGILTIPARDGTHAAALACVPFIPERLFGDAAAIFDDAAEWPAAYAEGVGHLLTAYAAAMPEGTVHLLAAHLFAAGAQFGKGGGEREVTVGPNYAVPASAMPATLSYLALGHIHRAQKVPGAPSPTWYSGSPLMLDFGEELDRKSVQVVDAMPGKPPTVESLELSAGRKLRTLRGPLDDLLRQAGAVGDAFLRLQVEIQGPSPGLADQLRTAFPNAVTITPIYPDLPDETPEPSANLTTRERFERFLRQRKGFEEVGALMQGFDELVEGIDA